MKICEFNVRLFVRFDTTFRGNLYELSKSIRVKASVSDLDLVSVQTDQTNRACCIQSSESYPHFAPLFTYFQILNVYLLTKILIPQRLRSDKNSWRYANLKDKISF